MVVSDAGSTLALSGVQVLVDHGAVTDTTNAEGIARLALVSAGRHLVSVRKFGFRADSQWIAVSAGRPAFAEFALEPAATQLPGVTTTAGATDQRLEGFMRRRAMGGGFFFTRGQIDSSNTRTVGELLRARTTARLVPGPGGALYLASHSANLRGFMDTPCWAQVYLDGTLIYNPLGVGDPAHNPPPDLRDYLSRSLAAVEYFPQPATTPVQFRAGAATCGTLVLWSR